MDIETADHSQQRQAVSVLNGVKLDLALAVTLCVLAALLVVIVPFTPWKEVLALALIASGSAVWVVVRTRQAVRLVGEGHEFARRLNDKRGSA